MLSSPQLVQWHFNELAPFSLPSSANSSGSSTASSADIRNNNKNSSNNNHSGVSGFEISRVSELFTVPQQLQLQYPHQQQQQQVQPQDTNSHFQPYQGFRGEEGDDEDFNFKNSYNFLRI